MSERAEVDATPLDLEAIVRMVLEALPGTGGHRYVDQMAPSAFDTLAIAIAANIQPQFDAALSGRAAQTCGQCRGDGWVCENHRSESQGHDDACSGAGEPCPACNPLATEFSRALAENERLRAGRAAQSEPAIVVNVDDDTVWDSGAISYPADDVFDAQRIMDQLREWFRAGPVQVRPLGIIGAPGDSE